MTFYMVIYGGKNYLGGFWNGKEVKSNDCGRFNADRRGLCKRVEELRNGSDAVRKGRVQGNRSGKTDKTRCYPCGRVYAKPGYSGSTVGT